MNIKICFYRWTLQLLSIRSKNSIPIRSIVFRLKFIISRNSLTINKIRVFSFHLFDQVKLLSQHFSFIIIQSFQWLHSTFNCLSDFSNESDFRVWSFRSELVEDVFEDFFIDVLTVEIDESFLGLWSGFCSSGYWSFLNWSVTFLVFFVCLDLFVRLGSWFSS